MAIVNGIIQTTDSEGISLAEISKVTGCNSLDLGTLCTSTQINPWARNKPIDTFKISKITPEERQREHFGLPIHTKLSGAYINSPYVKGMSEAFRQAKHYKGFWDKYNLYKRPSTKYRVLDFNGYDHTAEFPIKIDKKPSNNTEMTDQNTPDTPYRVGMEISKNFNNYNVIFEKLFTDISMYSDRWFFVILYRTKRGETETDIKLINSYRSLKELEDSSTGKIYFNFNLPRGVTEGYLYLASADNNNPSSSDSNTLLVNPEKNHYIYIDNGLFNVKCGKDDVNIGFRFYNSLNPGVGSIPKFTIDGTILRWDRINDFDTCNTQVLSQVYLSTQAFAKLFITVEGFTGSMNSGYISIGSYTKAVPLYSDNGIETYILSQGSSNQSYNNKVNIGRDWSENINERPGFNNVTKIKVSLMLYPVLYNSDEIDKNSEFIYEWVGLPYEPQEFIIYR